MLSDYALVVWGGFGPCERNDNNMNALVSVVLIGKMWGVGGAEKSLIMLANALAGKGYDVSLLAMQHGEIAYAIDPRVIIHYVPDKKSNIYVQRLARVANIIGKLKELKPDIVICFGMLVGIIAPKLLRIKTIFSERGNPGSDSNSGIVGLVRSLSFPFVDGFVFQVNGAKEFFSTRIQKKSTVIPNPVYMNYTDYAIPKEREKIIVNVGRIHSQKNQRMLITAFAKLPKRFSEFKLRIYGQDAGLRQELTEYAEVLGVGDRVEFMGTSSRLWDEIVFSRLFVLSSDYEGMPNSLMEAMALGVPCISTDCPPGGPSALIKSGVNGLLCPVGDSDKLASLMRTPLEDDEYSERIALAAKNICFTHKYEYIMDQWDAYIKKIAQFETAE